MSGQIEGVPRVRPLPGNNVGTLGARALALGPDATAFIDAERELSVSFREFDERVRRAAGALTEAGVNRGDRVALCFPNDLIYLELLFGAAYLGAVPVPVNVQAARKTITFVVDDSGADLVVAADDERTRPDAEAVAAETDTTLYVDASDPKTGRSLPEALAGATPLEGPAEVAWDDPAIQPYTSGSTGAPKGAILTHGGIAWNIYRIQQVHLFDGDERGLVAAPLYHKNAMVGAVKPLLAAGGCTVILDGFDTADVIATVDRYDVTYTTGVPAMFGLLCEAEEALAAHDVSSLTWAVCGSDTVPASLHEAFSDTFDADLLEAYGLTEGGPVVTLSPRWGPGKVGSAGLALPEVETRVIDPDTGAELPPGETGELLVSSPGVARYHNRPEAEAEAFEERDGCIFLHTEDLARIDEQGYHYIMGRLDDMLIVGGENIYPAEVENLLDDHPTVEGSVVVSVPHELKGEAPVAFVVAEGVSEAELKEWFIDKGPAYAHPRRVFFVEEFPLTGTGKVDRDCLKQDARERIDGPL
jgi:long-chain acyl-CoA synthetase